MTTIEIGPELTDDAPVGSAIGAVGAKRKPARVPVHRYVSPEWATTEAESMWPKVWQLACTVDHVAEPGDYYEYELGALSIMIVRTDSGELRAFQNTCRHRGNVLCTGSGSGLSEIRCPYHRWSWTLEGKLREVPSRKGFGALRNDDYPLLPVAIAEREPWLVRLDDGPPALTRELWLMVHPDLRRLTRIRVVMDWLIALCERLALR